MKVAEESQVHVAVTGIAQVIARHAAVGAARSDATGDAGAIVERMLGPRTTPPLRPRVQCGQGRRLPVLGVVAGRIVGAVVVLSEPVVTENGDPLCITQTGEIVQPFTTCFMKKLLP